MNMKKNSYGGILRTIRDNSGLSREVVASRLDIGPRTLVDYEGGKTEPSFSTILGIAEICKYPINKMLGEILAKVLDGSDISAVVYRPTQQLAEGEMDLIDKLSEVKAELILAKKEIAELKAELKRKRDGTDP